MSSTNKTTNYSLSQFVGTDVPSYLGDYNSDMSKIDKAIGDVANSQDSVEQSVVGLTADVQGLSTQVSGVSTSVEQLQTSVAQIDSGYKQADTALSQRITTNANNIQTNTTAIEGINTTIGTEDISGIGDGTIKGAIGNINSSLTVRKLYDLTIDENSKNFIELWNQSVVTYGNLAILSASVHVISNVPADTFLKLTLPDIIRKKCATHLEQRNATQLNTSVSIMMNVNDDYINIYTQTGLSSNDQFQFTLPVIFQ